uniref:NADH dehydrogenase subunit 2 n=1 Tax=Polysiphonia morrowii TaxID=173542 RepID=UPI002E76FB9D|nr:NADH dehydrogenase subunit 2 [Polysiphonia morrowii]WQF69611.1 NADH dehydrogenase subunit 2 [Polysiphonia morrowii]
MTLNIFYLSIYPLISEFFLLNVICFSLVFCAILSTSNVFKFPLLTNCMQFLFIQSLFFSFILLINSSPIFIIFFNKLLICDAFAFYSKIIILLFSIIWFWISQPFLKILNFEFWILILLSILSICLLIQAQDLLSIYVNIEFLSLSFYILASSNRNSEFSTEAGLKYFILGAFSSALLLFGFTLMYSFTGLTNLQDLLIFFTGYSLNLSFTLNQGIFISIFFILTSFLFKLGSAPFHYWLPDVYEGSPTSVTAFFAILPKLAVLSLFLRFIFVTLGDCIYNEVYLFLLIAAILSSLVGTVGALLQTKWKRFIAFSSISHVGFFLLNFCSLNFDNLNNLFVYIIIYLFMTSSFFSFFSLIKFFKFPNFKNPRFLNSLNSLNLTNPTLAILFSIILFSFAGIPPLAGFFAKFFVLYSAIDTGLFFLTFFLLFLNCVSTFYYINLIKKNYFNKIDSIYLPICVSNISVTNTITLSVLIFILILAITDLNFIFLFSNLMLSAFLN